jgi:hypothetical protein
MTSLNTNLLYPTIHPLSDYMEFIIKESDGNEGHNANKIDMALEWIDSHQSQLEYEFKSDASKRPEMVFIDWAITTYFFWKFNTGMATSIEDQIKMLMSGER